MYIWCVCIVCVHPCVYLQVHKCMVLVGRSDGNSGCGSLMSTLFSTRFLLCCLWLQEEFGENKYWLTRRSYFVCIFNKFRQLNLLKVNSINESQGFKQDLLTPEPITLPPTTLILAPSMVTSKCRYKWDWSSCGLHRCWGVLSTPKIREQIWV